ncbi:trypsin-like serine peptidase [Ornithinimicrobium sediminis]|uniref:trypsin-like serine peptidase n=1 Tax=Ornithinimicrobium sediminis TaxID=2904603 RepID=UPI001E63F740|nr:hypothetical protein [Ornithinimicrobium sediminis]MCE0485266.1 hypothetical protein [Ornithinimicrobium sediminis]
MRHSRPVSVAAAVGALMLAAGMAPATGAGGAVPDHAVERHAAATSKAEQTAVAAYWTPARMKSAVPRGGRIDPMAPPAGKGPGGGGGGGGGGNAGKAVQLPAEPRHGKVFFTLGGTNYVCSGTATGSTNGDVVTTAGHCLNEGPGDYATNFAFVPAYDNGQDPYGTWVAEELLTTSPWADQGDINHDVGFAVMAEQGGSSLTQVVGSFPIAFNLGYGLAFDAYGYPAATPYDGQSLWRCSGTAGRDTRGTDDHRLPCSMTGGSSGGGWITGGQLNSVNSFGYRGEKDVMYGPYFGNTEQAVYQAASTS